MKNWNLLLVCSCHCLPKRTIKFQLLYSFNMPYQLATIESEIRKGKASENKRIDEDKANQRRNWEKAVGGWWNERKLSMRQRHKGKRRKKSHRNDHRKWILAHWCRNDFEQSCNQVEKPHLHFDFCVHNAHHITHARTFWSFRFWATGK